MGDISEQQAESTDAIDSPLERFREYRRTRSRALRDALVQEHLLLPRQIARQFAHHGELSDDLVQAGSIGLIKAVERFDPEKGFEFSTDANRRLPANSKRHFREKTWFVRPPRRLQELYLQVQPAIEELAQRFGRSPTVREIAAVMGTSEEEVLDAIEAGNSYLPTSLDLPAPQQEHLAAFLGMTQEELVGVDDRDALRTFLLRLSERERTIIDLRFGAELTQAQIAERLGISQMHVSRLLRRALAALREMYGAPIGALEAPRSVPMLSSPNVGSGGAARGRDLSHSE